ncbi:MAG: sensor histidine kinase [Minisyncoccia bacterium]
MKNFWNLIKNKFAWPLWLNFILLIILLILSFIYLSGLILIITFFLIILIFIFTILFGLNLNANFNQANYKITQNDFQSIIETIDAGIIIYDSNFKINYFNPEAEKIFEIKKENILGKQIKIQDAQNERLRRLVQVIFPSLAPLVVLRSKENEEPNVLDISFTDPSLFLRVLTGKLKDENENIIGFIKIIHDRTTEINLLKSKSEFVTIASHQFRTPVNEIRWALESIISDPNLDSNLKELLSQTLKSVKRLENLIENLLNISKIEEGKFGYNFEETDYLAFIKGILAELLPQIKKFNLELYLNPPKEILPKIYIDPQKIYMVISNLLDNAVKYNVPNGRIVVSIKKAENGEFIETSVEDTGVGIPPEDLKNLFTKFFRSSTAQKFDTEGSGLGLYVVKNIIQSHGGKIWAESEVGHGTKITFWLPIRPELIPKKEIPLFDYE